MNISNYWLFFLCFIFFLGCNWNAPDECNGNNRKFQIDTEIHPFQYTFSKGDTLEISFELPNNIHDIMNDEYVNITDWRFLPNISLITIDEDELESANHKFEYVSEIGEFNVTVLSNGSWAVYCQLQEFDSLRVFKGSIVMHENGQYIFEYFNWAGDLVFEECPSRRVLLNYEVKNRSDNYSSKIESTSLQEYFKSPDEKMLSGYTVFEIVD